MGSADDPAAGLPFAVMATLVIEHSAAGERNRNAVRFNAGAFRTVEDDALRSFNGLQFLPRIVVVVMQKSRIQVGESHGQIAIAFAWVSSTRDVQPSP